MTVDALNNGAPTNASHAVAPSSPAASSCASSMANDSALGASPLSLSASPSPSSASAASPSAHHHHQHHHQHHSRHSRLHQHYSSHSNSTSVECTSHISGLRIAFAVIERHLHNGDPFNNNSSPTEPTIIDAALDNIPQELQKISDSFDGDCNDADAKDKTSARFGSVIVASTDDIRQTLYPFYAGAIAYIEKTAENAEKNENASPSFALANCMPRLFHTFVPYIAHASERVDGATEDNGTVESTQRRLQNLIKNIAEENVENLLRQVELVSQAYVTAVCCESSVDSSLIVRARGLPWQASDEDIAFFFVGLNIAPGGIALCLSSEGRRNGEALIRFENATQRELALRRNRKFLHNRYIEVYRATGDEFVRVAVGADAEAVRFVSRKAAMIVRMRGLPFQTTEQQIREFFAPSVASEEDAVGGETNENTDGYASWPAGSADAAGIVEPGGILFVTRSDGRPSGDAFVLFADEASGRRGLAKHKHRIGSRYVELFRTTQAEVQQLFNRTLRSPQDHQQQQQQQQQLQQQQQPIHQQQINDMGTPRRDCIRLRGLPYQAQVQQVVDFIGVHARNVVFQGVHMIFNNQGHPSGEAFIQMQNETAAAAAAQAMHNKYMELGKKKRYIEVFQCSPEDMNILLNAPVFPSATTLTAPNVCTGNVLPHGMMPMGLVPNNFMPFGTPLQTSMFRNTPTANFSTLLGPQVTSVTPIITANNSPNVVTVPATMATTPNNNIYAVPNNPLTAMINTSTAANNFCFSARSAPFGTAALPPGMMAAPAGVEQQQFQTIPFYVDANGSVATNAAALFQLQQQQAAAAMFGKTAAPPTAQFFSLPATAAAYSGHQFATLNGATYSIPFAATTAAGDGAMPPGAAPFDMVTMGISPHHQKTPFTLIHI